MFAYTILISEFALYSCLLLMCLLVEITVHSSDSMFCLLVFSVTWIEPRASFVFKLATECLCYVLTFFC